MTQIQQTVIASAQRGLNLQLVLRGVLVLFVICALALPPGSGAGQWWIAGGYLLVAIGLTVWLRSGRRSALDWGWLGLYLDLVVLLVLTLLADLAAEESWSSYVLQFGFFLIPVLAATQLNWGACAGVVIPTVVLYAVEGVVTQEANENEPWASIALRVIALAGTGLAAIWLSSIQRSRVASIRELVDERTRLLTELMTSTESARREMAENLHDGALQYVLAARMDLEDAREGHPPSFDRVDSALTQTAQLLRSTVSELHPAVLEQSGFALAIGQLTSTAAERAGLVVVLDTHGWPDDTRTDQDQLLFGVARELVSNVVRHARATRMTVTLNLADSIAELVVSDDGVGFNADAAGRKLSAGHIGIASQRLKIEAAGGRFRINTSAGGGATVQVTVPVTAADRA